MKDFDLYNIGNTQKRLISDEFYFRSIFKKTEKIVCAVSYVLAHIETDADARAAVGDLEAHARATLSFVGDTLSLTQDGVHRIVSELASRVVLLESKLRVLYARGVVHGDHFNVFEAEIDTLLRAIRSLESPESLGSIRSVLASAGPSSVKRRAPERSAEKVTHKESSQSSGTSTGDRRDRIKAVLIAAQKASIKDITDTITDCSEKTIQRELNAMIKDGLVVREGERRWSTYSYIGQ